MSFYFFKNHQIIKSPIIELSNHQIIHQRLINQRFDKHVFSKPEEIVSWMLAMQAQEYAMAKWAIGLRLPGSTDVKIEQAFNEGKILRTHIMRPTWHFVTAADIRWIIGLTAPHVKQMNAYMLRKLELDNKLFKRCNDIFIKMLEGKKHLTRAELNEGLAAKKIKADGLRLGYIMMQGELDAIICSGTRKENQFTYALLDERAPGAKLLSREEALNECCERYFASRGPATLQDFVNWSGLPVKDAKLGIALLDKRFGRTKFNGKEYIFIPVADNKSTKVQTDFLMPDYDEYGMSYKDRSAIFDPAFSSKMLRPGSPVYNRMIVLNGKIVGSWQRNVKGKEVVVETVPFSNLGKPQQAALDKAVKQYLKFCGKR